MEVDEIHSQFPKMRNGNGRVESAKMSQTQKNDELCQEEGDRKRGGGATNGVDLSGGIGRYYGWPSSRIVRVSRASGGKDRHSKVLTSKGLRDRRVRLSVNTAIQFYDLQDRLGYDQPSKAVEWLLKAASSSITELPPINTPFPDTPKQLSYEKRSSCDGGGSDQLGFDSVEVDMNCADPSYQQQNVTKSCSSNSETSKGSGSGLSLSRSENRIKARERAKGRVMEKEKEKEKENESPHIGAMNPISQTTSFTELLNGGMNNVNNNRHSNSNSPPAQWASTTMDYFTSGLLGRPAQMQIPATPLFSVTSEPHPEFQQFSFVPDHHFLPVNGGNNNESTGYNLNFSISSSGNHSSGLAGFNRGTLQSNSSSLLPHLQRFPTIDGSSPSFFTGAAGPADNHHQFLPGFDGRLHLSYGDSNSGRHSSHRIKRKN